MSDEGKGYTIIDRRGMNEGQEHPDEVCRVCGSKTVHSKQYGKPTMDCINYLNKKISFLISCVNGGEQLEENWEERL